MYGKGADEEIEEIARQTKKFTIPELEKIEADLKEKIKLLEKE